MIKVYKASKRYQHHLGGAHVCSIKPEPGSSARPHPRLNLAGITDEILLPGEPRIQVPAPAASTMLLTVVLAGQAEMGTSVNDSNHRLPAGTTLWQPVSRDGPATSWVNPSANEAGHLLRFWINGPHELPIPPPQTFLPSPCSKGMPQLLACPQGSPYHIKGPQGMSLWQLNLLHGQRWRRQPRPGQATWITLTSGEVWCCGKILTAGDTAVSSDEPSFRIHARRQSQIFVLEFEAEPPS